MYAIQYFRTPEVVAWYRDVGVFKEVAWVTGRSRFMKESEAQREADHINELGKQVDGFVPVKAVRAS